VSRTKKAKQPVTLEDAEQGNVPWSPRGFIAYLERAAAVNGTSGTASNPVDAFTSLISPSIYLVRDMGYRYGTDRSVAHITRLGRLATFLKAHWTALIERKLAAAEGGHVVLDDDLLHVLLTSPYTRNQGDRHVFDFDDVVERVRQRR
jgi:hypothetical protein